jgi:Universal stress protein family
MGSVSDSVIRHAHCPVLVVRGIVTLLHAARAGEMSSATVLRRVLLQRISHPSMTQRTEQAPRREEVAGR